MEGSCHLLLVQHLLLQRLQQLRLLVDLVILEEREEERKEEKKDTIYSSLFISTRNTEVQTLRPSGELGHFAGVLFRLRLSEFDPGAGAEGAEGAEGRSGSHLVVVECAVQGLDLCFGLLFIKLILHRHTLSCGGRDISSSLCECL
ncbi:hypothetical protein EYF80_041550 [Liparis tanakae]|uniref:Uncharacterized protein n=1 Tax=Liparis tanakae TaxID=230148 RepID=A0A4Z2G573_9TELE|nr:hypothetical protein EYF80_041550 [Liparis tanakae]